MASELSGIHWVHRIGEGVSLSEDKIETILK
jgi:hypothetical protein